jgi:hypothetical protein
MPAPSVFTLTPGRAVFLNVDADEQITIYPRGGVVTYSGSSSGTIADGASLTFSDDVYLSATVTVTIFTTIGPVPVVTTGGGSSAEVALEDYLTVSQLATITSTSRPTYQSNANLAAIISTIPAVDTALGLACAAAAARGGGTVRISKPGIYRLTNSDFEIPANVVLKGLDHRPPTIQFQRIGSCVDVVLDYAPSASAKGFLLNGSSGLDGLRIIYARQVTNSLTDPVTGIAQAVPYEYDWCIYLKQGSGSRDGMLLRNLMLLNPYRGIGFEGRTNGQWNMEHVHGQGLYRWLMIDRTFDDAEIRDVRTWTYYASNFAASPAEDALYTWIKANCRAFWFKKVDWTAAYKLTAFGVNEGLYCEAGADGNGPWADFYGLTVDASNVPLYFDRLQRVRFFGASFDAGNNQTANLRRPIITTSADVRGYVGFFGSTMYGPSRLGGRITSDTGYFEFASLEWKTITEAVGASDSGPYVSGLSLIVEGLAEVSVMGDSGTRVHMPIGSGNVRVNGIPLPSADTDVTPTNFNMASWSAGLPTGWVKPDGGTVTQITSGVSLDLGADAGSPEYHLNYQMPPSIYGTSDLHLVQLTLTPHTTDVTYKFFVDVTAGGSTRYWLAMNPEYAADAGDGVAVTVLLPVQWANRSLPPILRLCWIPGPTTNGSLDVTNLKLYKQDARKIRWDQLAMIQRRYGSDHQGYSIDPLNIGWTAQPLILPSKSNVQTANYSAVKTDAGRTVEMNLATSNTFTITNAVQWAIGDEIRVCQVGAGVTPSAAKRNECAAFWRGDQYVHRNSRTTTSSRRARWLAKPSHRPRTTRNLIHPLVEAKVSAAYAGSRPTR